jgi:hypothetical protein
MDISTAPTFAEASIGGLAGFDCAERKAGKLKITAEKTAEKRKLFKRIRSCLRIKNNN